MFTIPVRLNGQLMTTIGAPRLSLTLPEQATVADLLDVLAVQYPAAARLLRQAIPVVAGQHVTPATSLAGASEVALLMPIAGGCSGAGLVPVPAE
ncbi:MAG: MoaD/ThiS family protein [Chloroflexi bacterium]|jgi:molybdopterin converting factor small subunit|nr:MoaD/ThiS family protein [Chloroflexota bacterium]